MSVSKSGFAEKAPGGPDLDDVEKEAMLIVTDVAMRCTWCGGGWH